ncbi:MAG: hypothetical protein Q9221_004210 [Calogaya cf. arnoldii]
MLPTAGVCSIELPPTFKDKNHIVDLAKWYEEGINGTYAFDTHDQWFLDDIIEFEDQLKHGNGPKPYALESCECAKCVALFKLSWSQRQDSWLTHLQKEKREIASRRRMANRASIL